MDKGKSNRKKKGSSHADVIDRLDFSGVGPSTLPSYYPPRYSSWPEPIFPHQCSITMALSMHVHHPVTVTGPRLPCWLGAQGTRLTSRP